MESNRLGGMDAPDDNPRPTQAQDAQVGEEPARASEPRRLSAYSRERFLAVVNGSLTAGEYSQEVAQHVDAQISRDQGPTLREAG
jgi:hypothetical protein